MLVCCAKEDEKSHIVTRGMNCRMTKVKMLILFLALVFNFDFFEFSAAILEFGLFATAVKTTNKTTRWKKGKKIKLLLSLFKTATGSRKRQILGLESYIFNQYSLATFLLTLSPASGGFAYRFQQYL